MTFSRDISTADNYLGNAEIIASNHLDVIESDCVEGELFSMMINNETFPSDYYEAKVSVHIFNDNKFRQEAIPSDTWFCQLQLTFDREMGTLEVTNFFYLE